MAASRAKRAEVAERRRLCVELRVAGKTWDDIAAALGYKTKAAACQDFGRALKERLKRLDQSVDDLRALELERLDALYREAWAIMEKPHLLVQGGRAIEVVVDGQAVKLRDDGPKLAAMDRLLKIAERRARLLGIDAPVQIEQVGEVKVELVGVDLSALS